MRYLAPLLLVACARSAPSADVHEASDRAGDAATVDVGGWDTWPRINGETFRSEGHQNAWVDVHVPTEHADAYRAGTAPMPVGFRVVKASHGKGASPGAVVGLTVMVKMEPGYDPANGDWFYGVYEPSGTRARKQGKLPMCIECHQQWPEHDHLAGVPELRR